jgi:hypothetical protein
MNENGLNAAAMAGSLVGSVNERLLCIERILKQQLDLSQSSVKNFIGSGTVAGGGVVGVAPAPVVNGNPKRRGLSVQNLAAAGGGNLTLGLGMTAPQSGAGLVLLPGGSWDGRVSGALWHGTVSVVGSAAGVAYSWLEA